MYVFFDAVLRGIYHVMSYVDVLRQKKIRERDEECPGNAHSKKDSFHSFHTTHQKRACPNFRYKK
jgi:hypothetical protein